MVRSPLGKGGPESLDQKNMSWPSQSFDESGFDHQNKLDQQHGVCRLLRRVLSGLQAGLRPRVLHGVCEGVVQQGHWDGVSYVPATHVL